MSLRTISIAFLFTATLGVTACGTSTPQPTTPDAAAPAPEEPAEADAAPAPAGDAKDIVDTAVAAGSFETLVKAVQAADLVEVLKGEGPFTVFAPTDEAFAAVGEETLADLLKPENKEKLQQILKYHVVPGKVMSSEVSTMEADTAAAVKLPIRVEDGAVLVGSEMARVTKADIECSNGVIHVIDKVVMPAE